MQPPTEADYKAIVRLLKAEKIQFHTFQLREEKMLRVVIEGMVETISTDEIKKEPLDLGFNPGNIHRMLSSRTDSKGKKLLTRNIAVNVPQTEKTIFNMKRLANLVVKAESHRTNRIRSRPCHNCKLFGHSPYSCHTTPKMREMG